MSRYEELRALAEKAKAEEAEQAARVKRYPRTVWLITSERGAFREAASPDVILALLDERERLLRFLGEIHIPHYGPIVAGHHCNVCDFNEARRSLLRDDEPVEAAQA